MGFDVNRFVDSNPINEDLICNICKGVLEEAVWSPNCEHAFCKVCIQQWILRRSQCPNDRQPLNLAHLKPIPRFMRNILDKLEIKCDFANYGCQQVLHLESLRDHISVCDYNPDKRVECNMGCGIVLKKAELPNHNCVKSLRRAVDNLNEELQRCDRFNTRLRSEVNCLKTENNYFRESLHSLQNDVKQLLGDRQTTGIAHISQSSSSMSTLSSKSSRVVPNPYVLITPLQSSSAINDEPSSSTLGNARLPNEEPVFKRRTTIRVASPMQSVRQVVSTQGITVSVPTFSNASPLMITRSPSPSDRHIVLSNRSPDSPIETITPENDSNTEIVSESFPHSFDYITLDAEQDFEDNEQTEADDENPSIEQISDFDIEVQTNE